MSQYEFNITIKFAFWNSEESGSSRCRDYIAYTAGNSLNIPLYFNFNSSCYDPDSRYVLDIMSDKKSAEIADLLTQYNSMYNINFTLTSNIHSCRGDHVIFRNYGYPTIMTHSQFHSPKDCTENDTIETISSNYAKKIAQLGLSVLARLLEIQPK